MNYISTILTIKLKKMKNLKVILFAVMTISLMSCKSDLKKSTDIVEIVALEDVEKLGNDVQLIDVRTPEEYAEGYILHAKNVNFKADNFMELMSELNKDEPLYVYCMVGGRSGMSAAKLKEAGFTKVYDYKGGFKEWKAAGKTITMND